MGKILIGVFFVVCLFVTDHGFAQLSGEVVTPFEELIFEKKGGFDEIRFEDSFFWDAAGKPRLPVKEFSYVIPANSVVQGVSVKSIEKEYLEGLFRLKTNLPNFVVDGGVSDEIAPGIFGDRDCPNKMVEIVLDEVSRGYHVVHLRFFPVQYNPVSQKVSLITKCMFSIQYSETPEETVVARKVSQRRQSLIGREILSKIENRADFYAIRSEVESLINRSNDLNNPGGSKVSSTLKSMSLSVEDQLIPEYIIITSEAFKAGFQVLADWKTQKGVPAIVKTIESIEETYPGVDVQEKIRNYLIQMNSLHSGLFVLLGGNHQVVPARLIDGDYASSNPLKDVPSDLYYATVSGSWNGNGDGKWGDEIDYGYDHYLGRAPVASVDEVGIVVDKFIRYEKLDGDGLDLSYVENLFIGASFMDITKDGCSSLYYDCFQDVKFYVGSCVPSYCKSVFAFDNHQCDFNREVPYETPFCYDTIGVNCKGVAHTYVPGGECIGGDIEWNSGNFELALNGGMVFGNSHIIYQYDHAGRRAMGTSSKMKNESFSITDVANLSHNGHLQVLISGGCETASFKDDCIGSEFLTSANSNVVAFIGNADIGWANEHNYFRNFCSSFYSTAASSLKSPLLGSSFQEMAKISRRRQSLTLFGDPEASIWTKTPRPIGVSVSPETLVNGDNTIVVDVAGLNVGEEATICLWKKTEGYAVQTVNSNGSYSFSFSPNEGGEVLVTVTAHNYLPFEGQIPVRVDQERHLYLNAFELVDDGSGNSFGNDDSKVGAGETLELYPEIKNNGQLVAGDVFVEVTSSRADIVSVKAETAIADCGTISSGGSGIAQSPVVIQVVADAAQLLSRSSDAGMVKLFLKIVDSAGSEYFDEIGLEVLVPQLEQRDKLVMSTSDGDMEIEPGEVVDMSVALFNSGNVASGALTAILSTLSDAIEGVGDSVVVFDNIPSVESETSLDIFQFTVASDYVEGEPLLFSINVESDYGCVWSFEFDVNSRPAKFDINNLWQNPAETSIVFGCNSIDDPSEKYNFYRCEVGDDGNLVGDFYRVNKFLLEHALFNDSGLETLSPYAYRIGAVNEQGNESVLSDTLIIYTSYSPFRGFPVRMSEVGTILDAPVCVDADGDAKKEIFLPFRFEDKKHGALIGLNHDGTEMFDIDASAATVSGMAAIDAVVWAGVAVGDISGDDDLEVVMATRGGAGNCLAAYYTSDDNGGLEPNKVFYSPSGKNYIKSPVLCNVDNSDDGSLESLFSTEASGVLVVDNIGQHKWSFGAGMGWNTGALAASDLDNDGDLEIVKGYGSGIYIYHHDGTAFGSQPFFTVPGLSFKSSPVVGDLDNDGELDIVFSGVTIARPHVGQLYVVNAAGEIKPGWEGVGRLPLDSDWSIPGISIGDLDSDGNSEVVTASNKGITVFDVNGRLLTSVSILNFSPWLNTPVLGDIDADTDVEIVMTNNENGNVFGFNMDGSPVSGFPLKMEEGTFGSACLTDLDMNGKTDVVAASGNAVYVWETIGDAGNIVWGSPRFNAGNTASAVDGVGTGIDDVQAFYGNNGKRDVVVWPNPNKGVFTIKYVSGDYCQYSVRVCGLDGGVVFSANCFSPELELDLSDRTAGVYLLEIADGAGVETFKVIVN